MQNRLETLRRLVTLYAAVEEMHSVELQRMMAAVRETQKAIGAVQEIARSARLDGRAALFGGDRVCWMMAETRQDTVALRRRGLEQIRLEREELNDAAREQYVASRLKKEQIKRVLDDIATRAEVEEGRRIQATSDDRFLARRRWTDARKTIRNGMPMKTS
jgi:hypothetical protein